MTRVEMASAAAQRAIYSALSQNPAVIKALRETAKEVRDEARRRAPVDTGKGRKAIRHARHWDRKNRVVTYRVGWLPSAFYLKFVELGTVRQPARPFLRPAADQYARVSLSGGSTDESE